MNEVAELEACVSVHDVMPATLYDVLHILDRLRSYRVDAVTLLVVPRAGWKGDDLETLRSLRFDGYELAGHGRRHRCIGPRTRYHRLHGMLISGDVAEHLSRTGDEIAEMVGSCYDWFGGNDLGQPALYVPPAWAMGSIRKNRLRQLPFRFYEYLSGVYDARENLVVRRPLVGFEANGRLKVPLLRHWNRLQAAAAARTRVPLRISVHPRDYHLPLASQLEALLERCSRFLTVNDLVHGSRLPVGD